MLFVFWIFFYKMRIFYLIDLIGLIYIICFIVSKYMYFDNSINIFKRDY